MDDDEGDRSRIEKAIEAVKDMASSITDAAKSAATPSEEEKMTVVDVPLVADAAMPMPLVAPKKRKARVKRAPMKTPKKAAAAQKATKKTAKKSAKKSAAKNRLAQPSDFPIFVDFNEVVRSQTGNLQANRI